MDRLFKANAMNDKTIIKFVIGLLFSSLFGCQLTPEVPENKEISDSFRFKQESEQQLEKGYQLQDVKQRIQELLILTDQTERLNSNQAKNDELIKRFINKLPTSIHYKLQQQSYGFVKGENNAPFKLSLVDGVNAYFNNKIEDVATAIVIFSTGNNYSASDKKVIDKIFKKYHGKVCVYLVELTKPHADNRLLKPHYCGLSLSAEKLRHEIKLKQFLNTIFFYDIHDEDNDGINNSLDQCPGTFADVLIKWNGCPRDSYRSNPRYQIMKPQAF